MSESNTLGPYLRSERESRGLSLKTISENTKVSVALLEGLETDDISRWPGGIFRRAFVRSYAQCVGLDPDDVYKRFEQQHKPQSADAALIEAGFDVEQLNVPGEASRSRRTPGLRGLSVSKRARYVGTAADLTVAMILAFGSAAAGSRLLWPVLMIAAYYAAGVLLTGTTPMVALFSSEAPSTPKPSHTAATGDDANPLHA